MPHHLEFNHVLGRRCNTTFATAVTVCYLARPVLTRHSDPCGHLKSFRPFQAHASIAEQTRVRKVGWFPFLCQCFMMFDACCACFGLVQHVSASPRYNQKSWRALPLAANATLVLPDVSLPLTSFLEYSRFLRLAEVTPWKGWQNLPVPVWSAERSPSTGARRLQLWSWNRCGYDCMTQAVAPRTNSGSLRCRKSLMGPLALKLRISPVAQMVYASTGAMERRAITTGTGWQSRQNPKKFINIFGMGAFNRNCLGWSMMLSPHPVEAPVVHLLAAIWFGFLAWFGGWWRYHQESWKWDRAHQSHKLWRYIWRQGWRGQCYKFGLHKSEDLSSYWQSIPWPFPRHTDAALPELCRSRWRYPLYGWVFALLKNWKHWMAMRFVCCRASHIPLNTGTLMLLSFSRHPFPS